MTLHNGFLNYRIRLAILITIIGIVIFAIIPQFVFATSITGISGYLTIGGNANGQVSIGGSVPIIIGGNPTVSSNVTNLQAIPADTSITLNWSIATGSSSTIIRYSTTTYPTTYTSGTSAYSGNGVKYVLTGLTTGTTYYFSAWGFDGTNYSSASDTVVVTTTAGATAGGVLPTPPYVTPTAPSSTGWFAGLQPFSGFVQGFEQSWGMATDTMPFTFGILILLVAGIGIYLKTKSPFVAIVADFAIDLGLIALGLFSPYTIGVVLAFGAGVWALVNIWI